MGVKPARPSIRNVIVKSSSRRADTPPPNPLPARGRGLAFFGDRHVLAAAISLTGLFLGAAAGFDPPLRAMRWLAPGSNVARAVGSKPAECLPPTIADPDQAYLIALGRTAFRTPLLIGGQAARAGLACEGCHLNGRNNPDFHFPGVSGPPGTADITSSIFSSHRGDGIDNPSPIADLGGPKTNLVIDQSAKSPALAAFVHGLVTEEFDGPEPPPAVIQGLTAYLRAQDHTLCAAAPRTPVTLDSTMTEARRAVEAGQAALAHGDQPTAILMVQAGRSQLALVFERYDRKALNRDRLTVQAADLDLAAALADLRAGKTGTADQLTTWLVRSRQWEKSLARDEPKSLFTCGWPCSRSRPNPQNSERPREGGDPSPRVRTAKTFGDAAHIA